MRLRIETNRKFLKFFRIIAGSHTITKIDDMERIF